MEESYVLSSPERPYQWGTVELWVAAEHTSICLLLREIDCRHRPSSANSWQPQTPVNIRRHNSSALAAKTSQISWTNNIIIK